MNVLDCDFLLALAPVPIQITHSAPGCSFTDRTMPRSVDPFKVIVAGIPLIGLPEGWMFQSLPRMTAITEISAVILEQCDPCWFCDRVPKQGSDVSQSDAARYRRAHSARCGNDRGKRGKGASAGNVGNSRRAAATTPITQPFFLLSDLVSIGLAVRWHLSPRAQAYAVFLHPHAPYRDRRTRLSLSTGKSTEPDTHGREVAPPSYTDPDGPNECNEGCCVSCFSIRSRKCEVVRFSHRPFSS